jgi:hypothetical protein
MWQFKMYKRSQDLLQKYFALLQTLLNGFWLGVLSSDSLHKIDEMYYENSSMYYSADYNRRGLQKWEQAMIENYFQDCRRLLLLGAGGGREIYGLQKFGCAIEAFECNPKLLDFGNKFLREEGLNAQIKPVQRDACPASRQKYDGAIIGWGAYMLIQGRKRRIGFLRSIGAQLEAGAPLLLSFFTRNGDSRKFKATASVGNVFRFFLRRERLQTGDSLEPNYVHYFTENELKNELNEAGFKLLYYSSKNYGHAVAQSKNEKALSGFNL